MMRKPGYPSKPMEGYKIQSLTFAIRNGLLGLIGSIEKREAEQHPCADELAKMREVFSASRKTAKTICNWAEGAIAIGYKQTHEEVDAVLEMIKTIDSEIRNARLLYDEKIAEHETFSERKELRENIQKVGLKIYDLNTYFKNVSYSEPRIRIVMKKDENGSFVSTLEKL